MNFLKQNLFSLIALAVVICLTCVNALFYMNEGDNEGSQEIISNTEYVEQQVTNNIEINNSSFDITSATARGLQSAVSVYCTFTMTYGGNSFWNPTPTTQTYYSSGSGVIYNVDKDGNAYVLTNYHVVYDADSDTDNHISEKIYIYLYGLENESYAIEAKYVGGSPNYDIAVLKVTENEIIKNGFNAGTVAAAELADSNNITPGNTAIAIGNPTSSSELGGISATNGVVSVDSEYITMTAADERSEVTYRLIRIDTPVNAGNSGGGLYNAEGKLIGIVNAKISTSSIENIGYAIPSNVVRAVADNIIYYSQNGSYSNVMRCILGITVTTDEMSTYYDTQKGILQKLESVIIAEITNGGLADGKLQANDVIKSIKINEKTVDVTRQHHLIDTMLDVRVGDEVVFTVLRNGEEIAVSITIDENCLTAY
ncbi:MAG: trypsin-like peptidase domain-containing protein [Clostridia bacterium]|nr:trypsin-like peptidase domain-containing protein [Clostridia bacterium]